MRRYWGSVCDGAIVTVTCVLPRSLGGPKAAAELFFFLSWPLGDPVLEEIQPLSALAVLVLVMTVPTEHGSSGV